MSEVMLAALVDRGSRNAAGTPPFIFWPRIGVPQPTPDYCEDYGIAKTGVGVTGVSVGGPYLMLRSALISRPMESNSMVGRQGELSCLLEHFSAVSSGRGGTIAISGDAGIGKSRLLQAFKDEIGGQSALFYIGHCYEQVRAPYLPFEDLDTSAKTSTRDFTHRLDQPSVPEEKLRHFASVTALLRRAADRKPVVLVIEDIQWADTASLELITFLAQRLSSAKVQLIVTFRSDANDQSDLLHLMAIFRRLHVTEIELHALSRGEAQEIIYRALRGRASLPVEVRARIEDTAEGNPLFIEELLRSAIDSEAEGSDRTIVPVTIRAILRQRLEGFSEQDVHILRIAAVIGRTFDAAFLARVSGLSTASVLEALKTAWQRQLIVEQGTTSSTFVFRHALIREALCSELLGEQARTLHGRIGQELLQSGDSEGALAELAYHWAAACDDERAIEFNERAGDRAVQLCANRDAVHFYRKALAFSYPPGWARGCLYEKLAAAQQAEGLPTEPTLWLSAAVDEYQEAGDPIAVAKVLLLLAKQSWVDCRTEEGLTYSDRALSILRVTTHEALRVRAQVTHASLSIDLGRVDEAMSILDDVHGGIDPDFEPVYLLIRGETRCAAGDADGCVADFEKAIVLADRQESIRLLLCVDNSFGSAASDLGLTDLAVAIHSRALKLSERSALAQTNVYLRVNAARTAFLSGELNRARDLVVESLAAGADNAVVRTRASAIGIPIALALGDEDLVTQLLQPSILEDAFASGEPQRYGSVAAAFAQALRYRGQPEGAREIVDRAMEILPRFHRCWDLTHQASIIGSDSSVAKANELLMMQPNHPVAKAFLALLKAETALRAGDSSGAAVSAREAATAFRALRWPLYEAMSHRLAGDEREALAINLRIGNLREAGDHHRARRNDIVDGPSLPMLTIRQQQIADLVVQGFANRAIAERLGISEGTVENHLVAVYKRIGIRSRMQLVSYTLNTASIGSTVEQSENGR